MRRSWPASSGAPPARCSRTPRTRTRADRAPAAVGVCEAIDRTDTRSGRAFATLPYPPVFFAGVGSCKLSFLLEFPAHGSAAARRPALRLLPDDRNVGRAQPRRD